MSGKLLSDANIDAIDFANNDLGGQDAETVSLLIADIRRYRKWCRRLVETAGGVKQLAGLRGDNVYALAEEVRAALEKTS